MLSVNPPLVESYNPKSQPKRTLFVEFTVTSMPSCMLKSIDEILAFVNVILYGRFSGEVHETVFWLFGKENEYGLQMFFPNKSNFIKIIKSCGFEVKDVGYAMFKVFNSFENEIIISAVKK